MQIYYLNGMYPDYGLSEYRFIIIVDFFKEERPDGHPAQNIDVRLVIGPAV